MKQRSGKTKEEGKVDKLRDYPAAVASDVDDVVINDSCIVGTQVTAKSVDADMPTIVENSMLDDTLVNMTVPTPIFETDDTDVTAERINARYGLRQCPRPNLRKKTIVKVMKMPLGKEHVYVNFDDGSKQWVQRALVPQKLVEEFYIESDKR